MKRYDLIVFDWDGTLYDSVGHIVSSIRESAEHAGLDVPSKCDARQVIGLNFNMALLRLFPDATRAEIKTLSNFYTETIKTKAQGASLFEGSKELLETLQAENYLLAVATGKRRAGFDEDLKLFEAEHIFQATRCGDEGPSKPHPQILEEIMLELDVSPDKTLMVGDTEYDLNLAKNVGAHSVGVTYGVHSEEILRACDPQHCINDISELLTFLKRPI